MTDPARELVRPVRCTLAGMRPTWRFAFIALVACGGHSPAPPPPPAPVSAAPAPAPSSSPAWLGIWFETGTTRALRVVEGGPAARAGFLVGDEIRSIDGVAVNASQQIVKRVSAARPGTRIAIAFTRAGQPRTAVVELAARPPDDRLMRDALVDQPAPPFTAPALDGGAAISISELHGTVVLVDFWATWCGPCTMQFPHLNDWHQRYASRGLRIVALSDEEPDLVREYARAEKLAYPLALDPDARIRLAYLVPGMPTTVIIDRQGIVRYVTVGVADPAEIEAVITRLL
jgi:peroxiredoxin